MKPTATGQHLRRSVHGIADELRLVRLRGERASLCLQTTCSVVLAVMVADALHLSDRWWVALSAYAVLRADLRVMLRRCLERMAGTIAGALLGLVLALALLPHADMRVMALAGVAGFGIYAMVGSRWTYSWVLGTVTALMVLGESTAVASPAVLAVQRVIDVAVGVSSTLVVAILFYAVHRHDQTSMPGTVTAAATTTASNPAMHRLKATQACQGAVSVALLAGIHNVHALPGFPQAMVSVVAVLLVPLPVLLRGVGTEEVQARMFNRVLGCLCAALLAAPLLPFIGEMPVLCLLALTAGVWLAAHVQSGSAQVSYIGTQFGVGFIMVFVQDHGSPDASNTWARLAGIVLALAALSLVMMACALWRRPSSPT